MEIKVEIKDGGVKQKLAEIAAKGGNLTPIMRVIGEIVRTSVERNFAAGGRPTWAESQRVKREGGQTLSRSGILRRSFTLPGAVVVGNNRVSVGTNVKYAAIHQFGGKTAPHTIVPRKAKALFWPGAKHPVKSIKHPGSVIPARPFMMVQDEDWTEIKQSVMNYYLSTR